MNKEGTIIVIEDDVDDQEILDDIFLHLGIKNKVLFFKDGDTALEYLIDVNNKPFLILSDINMPKLNGLELREKIHNNEELRLRCIPYLFFTTTATQDSVINAYSKSVQGFFIKPVSIDRLEHIIQTIIQYWQYCESPNYIK